MNDMTKSVFLVGLALALALPSFADEYRATLTVYPGDDVNVIAAEVAATYGARVTAAGESEFVTLDVPASRESLLRNDPRVARLEPIAVAPTASAALVPRTDAYATPWTLGNYAYDGGGNITAVGTTSFTYDGASRVLSGGSGDGHVQSYTYDGFGNILTITTDGGLESVGVNRATNQASVTSANIFGTYDTAGRVAMYLNSDHFTYDGLDSIKESTLANVRRAYLYTASDERIAVIGLDQYARKGRRNGRSALRPTRFSAASRNRPASGSGRKTTSTPAAASWPPTPTPPPAAPSSTSTTSAPRASSPATAAIRLRYITTLPSAKSLRLLCRTRRPESSPGTSGMR